jgi:hypothetical protein
MADEIEKVSEEMEEFLSEKFPKADPEGLDYSNPLDPDAQFAALKASRAKTDLGPAEVIRRLKSGRKFE